MPNDELAYKEHKRFWPTSKIDIFVKIQPEEYRQELVTSIADKLAASSFYLELEEDPWPHSNSPTVIQIVVKCRLPPGPALADFMMKFRSRSSRFHSSAGSSSFSPSFICPQNVWEEIKRGGEFSRRLQVEIWPSESLVDVQADSLYGAIQRSISNCPCDLSLLRESQRSAE